MKARHLQMEATFHEKALERLKKISRRHTFLRPFCLAAVVVVTVAYHIVLFFKDNTKRFVSTACVLGAFAASASFSYPTVSMAYGFAAMESGAEVMGATRQEVSLDELLQRAGEAQASSDVRLISQPVVQEEASIAQTASQDIAPDETDERFTLADFVAEGNLDAVSTTPDAAQAGASDTAFSATDWRLILINKQHPLPADYTFPLGSINRSMVCDERIRESLVEMLKAAQDDGISLEIRSPYRNISRQEYLFGNHIEEYMAAGYSFMEAYSRTSQTVTVPGASEHQAGLALDITSASYSSLDASFGQTLAGQWLAENSYRFGFVVRYPSGKEDITGIAYEPWHFRFVGKEAAAVMFDENLTLEEFWDKYLYH